MNHERQYQREAFSQQVQDALAHLYDHVYLQQHPLARLLSSRPGEAAHGRTLHRVLVEAIGELKPARDARQSSTAWRKYQYLVRRYLEGRSAMEVAEELGISGRQARRYHHEATEAIVSILWERYEKAWPLTAVSTAASLVPSAAEDTPGEWSALLQTEIARIGAASASSLVSLEEALSSVIASTASLAQARRVQLHSSLSPNLPPVSANRVLLRHILFNVVTHAMLDASGGAVTVAAHPDTGRRSLVVSIEFSRQAQAMVAEPLLETDRLRVVHQLLASIGGELEVSSLAGQQSLRLVLPAASPVNVLVVDDNPDIVQLFRRFLSGRPYQVFEAGNGAKALEAVRTQRPQVIILDVMMPNQDGWELLQVLRNLPETEHTPIVVCSVLPERELATSLGAAEFLSKPVTQQALLSVLERFLAPSSAPPALS